MIEKGRIEFDDPTFRPSINRLIEVGKKLDMLQREVRELRHELAKRGVKFPILNLDEGKEDQ